MVLPLMSIAIKMSQDVSNIIQNVGALIVMSMGGEKGRNRILSLYSVTLRN